MSKCIVLVCNKKYLSQFEYTYNLLRTNGKYNDDIVLVVGDDLKDLKYEGVIVKYFKNISFPQSVVKQMDDVNTDGRNITKRFQWHKLHIFESYFKKWKVVSIWSNKGRKNRFTLFKVMPILSDTDCVWKVLASR